MKLFNHTIAYNISDFKSLSSRIEKYIIDINKANTDLKKCMETLKVDWNTPASRKFFDEHECNWEQDINNYMKSLELLKSVVDEAIIDYSSITAEAKRLLT